MPVATSRELANIRQAPHQPGPPPGWRAPGAIQRYMLWTAVAAQAITVLITWSAWQVRAQPVNLPVLPLPQVPFGLAVLVSLLPILRWPRIGILLHSAVLVLAYLWDEHRLQPRILSVVI